MLKIITLLIAVMMTLTQAFALPYLSFNGEMEQERLVLLDVQVEATGSSGVCFEARYRNGIIVNNPHVYNLSTWSMSNFAGYYALDYATEARLDHYLMERFQESGINGVDYKSYIDICAFKIKKVELTLADTLLILTNSKDAKTDLILELEQGVTRAHVFNFDQGRNFFWFKVNIK